MNNVYVAKLGKTVGLKGHVKIFIDSDFPNQFRKDATFTTNKNTSLIVEEFNASRGVIKFKSIDDIDTAKKLTNTQLYTSHEQTREACTLDDKQYFWFDMIDCKIVENEQELGKIKDIHRYPTSDYLEIITSDILIEEGLPNTFLIPYIDTYILNVDIDSKIVQTKDALAILENS